MSQRSMDNSTRARNKGNRTRGKKYERLAAEMVGGVRNLDKSRPHTDVETEHEVFEIKSTQASTPSWLRKAMEQLSLASKESNKKPGGVIRVHTGGQGGKVRGFLIQEIANGA